MKLLAFSFLLFILAGFGAVAATVIYHFRRYSVPSDKTREILRFFIAGSVVFLIATLFVFLFVPWDELSLSLLVL